MTVDLVTANDAPVLVVGDFRSPDSPPILRDHVTIDGDTGSIEHCDDRLTLRSGRTRDLRVDVEADYRASYRNAIERFVDRTRRSAGYETSLADQLRTLELVEMGYADMARSADPARHPADQQGERQ